MGCSPGGRERLASGVLGCAAASFGRCLQHMHAPESLQSALAGRSGHSHQPQHGSTAPRLMQEAACFVAAAAREGQRGLSGAAPPAARAACSLYSSAAMLTSNVERAVSTGLQVIGPPAHACAQKLGSGLWQLCPVCKAPVLAAVQACRQTMQQQRLWLENSSALSSQLHPAEQLACWAPSKPSDMLTYLMQASRIAAEAALQLVPSTIHKAAHAAWARVSTSLGTCAIWTPKEEPKLTPLHSALFLTHDSANFALHGLKHAVGPACVMAEHAATRGRIAIRSASAGAANLRDLLAAMLRFSSVAAMTDSERDAYLAAKSAHQGDTGHTLPEGRAAKSIRSWWGSLVGRNGKHASGTAAEVRTVSGAGASAQAKVASAAQREAEYRSEPASTLGLTHVQTADGGSIMWAGQPGQSRQPGQPEGLDIITEDAAGMQDVVSAAGGMATLPEQPNEPAEPTRTASDIEEASTLHHVQSERGGSITWQGEPAQQQSEQRGRPHTDAGAPSESQSKDITEMGSAAGQTGPSAHGDARVACGEEHQQTAEAPAAASRGIEDRGDRDMAAEAAERREPCSATAPCEAQAHHAGVEVGNLKAGEPASEAQGMPGAVGKDVSTQPSGRQDAQRPAGQVNEGATAHAGMEAAASRGSPLSNAQGKEGCEAPGNEIGAGGGGSSQAGSQTHAGGTEEDIAGTLADAVHALQTQHAQPDADRNMRIKTRGAEVRSQISSQALQLPPPLDICEQSARHCYVWEHRHMMPSYARTSSAMQCTVKGHPNVIVSCFLRRHYHTSCQMGQPSQLHWG